MKPRLRAVDGKVPSVADDNAHAERGLRPAAEGVASGALPANDLAQLHLDRALCELHALRTALEAARANEAHLRTTALRFRSLTELASDWYWEQDENLRFVSHSGVVPSA